MTRIFTSVLFALTLLITTHHASAALTLSYGTATHTVPAQNSGTPTDLMTITCPTGTVVVSGGWESNSTAGQFLMVWVSRQVANTWRIMTVNHHPTQPFAITGYAVCASGISGMGSYSSSLSVSVNGFSGSSGNAFCPNGGFPTGGGFDSNFPNAAQLIPIQTRPAAGNQWVSAEYNSTSTSKAFTVYVTCLTGVSGSVTQQFGNWVAFRNGPSVEASVDCSPGEFAIGAGFVSTITTSSPSTTTQLVRTFINRPSTNTVSWAVRGFNANQFDWANLRPVVQCLRVN